jgi:predicted  nucleic acid-binding Zn-ribbon protein
MRRPHRSIETFDISLMAVVTKAMGAFLVLMLLLMPYYSSSPLGKDEAQDLARKVQGADAKIKGVLDRLGDKELSKDLMSAREELGSGQQLINQLKRYVDQFSAQVARLEEKIVTLTAELDQLKKDKSTLSARVAELEKENAVLKPENEKLKAEIERLNKRIAELEMTIADLNKRIAELERSEPEKVEQLKKQIEELKKEIAKLKQENADLNARVAALEDEAARLRARNAELEQQNAQLNALVVPLQQENAQLKAQITPLQQENAALKAKIAELESLSSRVTLTGVADSSNCQGQPFSLGTLSASSTLMDNDPYIFNKVNSSGGGFDEEDGEGYVSMLIAKDLRVERYFLYLLFRPKGEENGPLRRPKQACTVNVTILIALPNRIGRWRRQISFGTDRVLAYIGDVVVTSDGDADFTGPTPEGTAYLDDQIAHAAVERP